MMKAIIQNIRPRWTTPARKAVLVAKNGAHGTGNGHAGGADGKRPRSSHTDGIPLGSHQASLSLDANRGMMKVHLPLGSISQ